MTLMERSLYTHKQHEHAYTLLYITHQILNPESLNSQTQV